MYWYTGILSNVADVAGGFQPDAAGVAGGIQPYVADLTTSANVSREANRL